MKRPRNPCLTTVLLLALIAPASPAAPAASTTTAAAPSTTIAIDCAHRYISQRDAARVLGTDNFWQTYAKRQSLYAHVARLCHSGVERVLLVASDRPPEPRTAATR